MLHTDIQVVVLMSHHRLKGIPIPQMNMIPTQTAETLSPLLPRSGNKIIPGSNLRLLELKPVLVLHPLLPEEDGGGLMEKFCLDFSWWFVLRRFAFGLPCFNHGSAK